MTTTTVTRAEPPRLLVYNWGGNDSFLAMGAAGWHVCLDVLDRLLNGTPIGRIAGPEAMKVDRVVRIRI